MKTTNTISARTDFDIPFIREMTIANLIPDNFTAKSTSSVEIQIEPSTEIENIIPLFKDCDLHHIRRLGKSKYDRANTQLFFKQQDAHLICANIDAGRIHITVISPDDNSKAIADIMAKSFDSIKFKNEETDGAWVDFVYMTSEGPVRTSDFIKCPEWKDIIDNYQPKIASDVNKIIHTEEPWKNGRMIIWHGLPGTGKTYAIRALIMEWKDKYDFVVVNDPEELIRNPGYYYQVASSSTERPMRIPFEDEGPKRKRNKRNVFILEDSADLIIVESRSRHYDKINKFLNITDGLFGQGREDLFLMTFNEEKTEIDSAFTRPGRCIAITEFTSFSKQDAKEWLIKHDVKNANPDNEMTLASMYAEKSNHVVKPNTERVGF